MQCPRCHFECAEEDIRCRRCGAELTTSSRSIIPAQPVLPAVLQHPNVQRGVAASVGALALGVGLELLRRGVVARLTRPSRPHADALPVLSALKDILAPHNNKSLKPPRGYEIHETVVYMRRVIRRAD